MNRKEKFWVRVDWKTENTCCSEYFLSACSVSLGSIEAPPREKNHANKYVCDRFLWPYCRLRWDKYALYVFLEQIYLLCTRWELHDDIMSSGKILVNLLSHTPTHWIDTPGIHRVDNEKISRFFLRSCRNYQISWQSFLSKLRVNNGKAHSIQCCTVWVSSIRIPNLLPLST